MSARHERLALTQTMFRAANEAILGPSPQAGPLTFICECGDESCMDAIELTPEEYAGVRGDGRCFVIKPGHENEVEAVVAELEGFTLVEKLGAAARIAVARDPRAT